MIAIVKVTRREFLTRAPAAGAGLVLGFRLMEGAGSAAAPGAPAAGTPPATAAAPAGATLAPNAWLQVAPDGTVTIWVAKSEMGQGVRTALPMIVAEELGADWSRIAVEQAPLDARYGDQETGGSSSVRTSWEPLRKAGAAARVMLIAAAAKRLGVNPASLVTERGEIISPATGKRLPFAAVVSEAAALDVPQDPPLEDPRRFSIVGRVQPRTDTPLKIDGRAVYGLDVRVPGMLFAAVARCPVFGGTLARFDEAPARKVPEVRGVVPIGRGVAVVADSTWAAFKGREALKVTWDEGKAATESSDALRERCLDLSKTPGGVVRSDGDAGAALERAARRVEAVYEAPFQAHAAMEPVNATVHVEKDRCTVWAPTQSPGSARDEVRKVTGLPAEAIRVNVTFLGGGFGRRLNSDFVADAAEISKAVAAPVQVVFSRDEDLQHDFYRPFSVHRLEAGLDAQGSLTAWRHRLVTTSIAAFYDPATKTPESDEIGGAFDLPFAIPNVQVEYHAAASSVPRGYWRSVDSSFNAFAVESFVDEIAAAAGRDPLRMRLDLLKPGGRFPYPGTAGGALECDRLRAVAQLAADKASWGAALPAGRGRGIAAHYSFRSYCAQVAEVEVGPEGALKIHRVVCALDCGRVIHPGLVAAQMESAVAFGLTAAIKSGITIEKGRVRESNFHDFEVLRIDEMPRVEVYTMPGDGPPTGVGEPGVPPVAPAVANAVFAATTRRLRRLPIRAADLRAS